MAKVKKGLFYPNKIREIRIKRGIYSAIELSKLINVSPIIISSWECGKTLPNAVSLIRLEMALGVMGSELIDINNPLPTKARKKWYMKRVKWGVKMHHAGSYQMSQLQKSIQAMNQAQVKDVETLLKAEAEGKKPIRPMPVEEATAVILGDMEKREERRQRLQELEATKLTIELPTEEQNGQKPPEPEVKLFPRFAPDGSLIRPVDEENS